MTDIIDRLNDPDTCMDAIDDAIAEIKLLRSELSDALLANDEAASAARWNNPALAAEIDALRELLSECEYSDYQDGPDPLCPICGYARPHGHGGNCKMAALLVTNPVTVEK